MNEITRIHLAKTPYSVELGAKKDLETYLHDISVRMHADAEVLREIEARMVELLAVRGVTADQVITHDDVMALRAQLGDPRDFADGDEGEEKETENHEEKPTKRFMRDVDHAVLGGVCSGMAAYFNVDVLIVRLIATALFILSAGSLILVYIVFWIITPAARTTADKLTMAGRPVTIEALKDSAHDKPHGSSQAQNVARIILGTVTLLAMAGVLIGVCVGGFIGYDAVMWLSDFRAQPWVMGMLSALVIGGVALTVLLGLLAKSAFSWKVGRPTGIAMIVMMAVGLFAIIGISVSAMQMQTVSVSDLKRLTKTENVTVPADIKNVISVQAIGANVTYGYAVPGEPLRVEVQYLAVHDSKKPNVTVQQQNDTLFITVSTNSVESCPIMLRRGSVNCSGLTPTIIVYGIPSSTGGVVSPSTDSILLN